MRGGRERDRGRGLRLHRRGGGGRGVRAGRDGTVAAPPEPARGDPKAVVRRLIDEVMNQGRLDVIDELYAAALAPAARRWIEPFRESFPDTHMDIVTLVAEGHTVAGRFRCSGTHLGPWRGHAPTGRRFRNVSEAYFFTVEDGAITAAWGIEDVPSRLRQLGLDGDGR